MGVHMCHYCVSVIQHTGEYDSSDVGHTAWS